MSFAHQSRPPGVTIHGLLEGLDVDDHAQYALADKSRPSPWVEAADLAALSIADLGAKDHDLLDGLGDDDHSIYALLAGRSGGQTFIGGLAAFEHLTLQSTADATRGYVRAQDDLQLLSNIIRDSGGNARLTLAAASPHVSLTGDLDVSAHAAIGAAASPATRDVLAIADTNTTDMYGYGVNIAMIGARTTGAQVTYGVTGSAKAQGTPQVATVAGLYFLGTHASSSPCSYLAGAAAFVSSVAEGTGALTLSRAFHAPAANWVGSKPATACGLDIEEQGGAGVTIAHGIRVQEQTATNPYLLTLAGAYGLTYLQVRAGAWPSANQTKLYLLEGFYLRHVQCMDPGVGGANFAGGERVMILA